MIVIDPVAMFIRNGRRVRAAHLLSDQVGYPGLKELMGFAVNIGLRSMWLQKQGTAHEHFDVMNTRIDEAIKAGALKIDRYRLVEIIRDKRDAIERVQRVKERVARRPSNHEGQTA